MSKLTILNKSAVIRNETQPLANTRGRVADVLEDIANTLVDQDDLNAEATARDQGDAMKLDKPNPDGSYYITKITVAGIPYYQYRDIHLSSGQIPVSMGTYIGASLLYESVSGRIGLDTQSPTEKFEVYNGRVKADGFILTSSAVAPLPREIKFKVGNFVGAKDDGIERKFLMEGDLDTELATKLDKGTYTGTAQNLENSIDSKLNKPTTTSNTTSYPFVVGENGNGGSARLPAGDLGKNFFNSDLSNTTARNHTMNAGVTVNTLGNPYSITGLPNKNADIANFRKVRVQNTSGLDAVSDSKTVITDAVTSMSDAEKDAWRLAQRKTGENYSTGQPAVHIIFPIIAKRETFEQNITLNGVNLYIDLANQNSRVYLKNVVTGEEITITNVGVSQFNTGFLSFWYNLSTIPVGEYYVRVKNQLGITSSDTVKIKIVSTLNIKTIPNFSWEVKLLSGYTLNYQTNYSNSNLFYATKGTSNQVKIVVASFKATEPILTAIEAAGNWQIYLNWNYGIWGIGNGGISLGIDKTSKTLNLSRNFLAGFINTSDFNENLLHKTIPDVSGSYFVGFNATSLPSSGKFIIEKQGLLIKMIHLFDNNQRIIGQFSLSENLNESLSLFAYVNGSNTTYNGDISDFNGFIDKVVLN